MTRIHAEDQIKLLRDVVRAGCMTDADRGRGQKLLDSLERPARIATIGRRGSGKTSLLNVLLGEKRMPDIAGPTIIELIDGDQTRFSIKNGDISQSANSGLVTESDLPEGCKHVVQEASLPNLKTKSLFEINLPDREIDQEHAVRWMAENTDIVIWCTQEFSDAEHSIWSKVPEALKDHSFLAVTHADQLLQRGTLNQVTTRFHQRFADDFMGLYPIAAKHALSACRDGSVVDAQLWQASGGEALLQAVEQDIGSGKQADLDYAEILVARYEPLPAPLQDPNPTPDSSNNQSQAERSNSAPQAKQAASISPMKRSEAIDTALTVLQAPVDEMLRNFENEIPEPAIVLDHTAQAAQALATLFMDASTEDTDLNNFRNNVLECEQMVQLLQLEGTETAACDAATVLLQLKKEMSEVAYA